jgi:predicted nucleotide-binding protein (sugar kinase/HSP70/actin superfamily)
VAGCSLGIDVGSTTVKVVALDPAGTVLAWRYLGGRKLVAAMNDIAARIEALPVQRAVRRPRIGVIGEIYLRFNDFSNQHLVRRIEATGGEAAVASICEWFYFTNWLYGAFARQQGTYRDWLVTLITDVYQRWQERRLVRPVAHLLDDAYESSIGEMMRGLRPHYSPLTGLETEAGLSLAKAFDFAGKGLCGVVNIMPFGCMPGIIVAGMASRLRDQLNSIPWLDISYDALGETNSQTRLEAFMYQAHQYQRSGPRSEHHRPS